MKRINRKIGIEFKIKKERKVKEKWKFKSDNLIKNILRRRKLIKRSLVCTIIFLSFFLSGKTAAKILVNNSYHMETVTVQVSPYETAKQGFNLKSSVLISIGLGASLSIVHRDNRKTQEDS